MEIGYAIYELSGINRRKCANHSFERIFKAISLYCINYRSHILFDVTIECKDVDFNEGCMEAWHRVV